MLVQYPQSIEEEGENGPGRGSDLPNVTQKVRGTAWFRTWVSEFLRELFAVCFPGHPPLRREPLK